MPANKDELKCEAGTSKSLAKFVKAKGKCVQKCLDKPAQGRRAVHRLQRAVRRRHRHAASTTRRRAPRRRRVTGSRRPARRTCPDCYDAGGNCPDGANFVAAVEGNVDDAGPLVYCLEAAGMTPTKAQAKCEDGVAKSLIKFAGSKSKCYDKCVDKEFKGKLPAGSCTAGSPSDADDAGVHPEGRGQGHRGHRQGVRGVGREAVVLRSRARLG